MSSKQDENRTAEMTETMSHAERLDEHRKEATEQRDRLVAEIERLRAEVADRVQALWKIRLAFPDLLPDRRWLLRWEDDSLGCVYAADWHEALHYIDCIEVDDDGWVLDDDGERYPDWDEPVCEGVDGEWHEPDDEDEGEKEDNQ